MFDIKEDKKVLKVEIVNILGKTKKSKTKRLYSLFTSIKIASMYFFALVGFSLLFYHFLLGQPYLCTKYKYYNPNQPILNQEDDNIIEKDLSNCQYDLSECQIKLDNMFDNFTDSCLQEVFKPICEELD